MTHVEIRDDLISPSQSAALAKALEWLPMYFVRRTERNPDAHPLDVYWYYPIAASNDPYTQDVAPELDQLDDWARPIRDSWDQLKSALAQPGKTLRLYEVEVSANGYGTDGHPHHDCPRAERREHHITAIVYCNPEWDLAWGGETLVFDQAQEIQTAIRPRPGRITILHGDPLHVARGVSRICPLPRRVLVFKMWQA